ncbi:MAG TPA: hypothetical protein VEF34_12980, partial [Syntrophobacteraceae bacterium]|nr:hypothetical protein [Syntrophobacteraceae bacterium]
MCGIAGIYNRNGAKVPYELLARMTRTLAHRGPDEEGYFLNVDGTISESPTGPASLPPLRNAGFSRPEFPAAGNVG